MPLRNITTSTSDDQLDAFGNMRTAAPTFVADGQLTYDLQPLLYEQITSGTGAVAHDSTERCANLTAPATGDVAAMQSYEHYRYQAGRAQEVYITFNFNDNTGTSGLVYTAEYGDGSNNGIGFRLNGTTKEFFIRSNTTAGDNAVAQSSWNIDKLDGTGVSGITLDTTKVQILVIDIQALYVGRVRLGFDIDGLIYWAHEFNHANSIAYPYIQTANLPIRVSIVNGTGGAITEELNFICSSVLSRGGQENVEGFSHAITVDGTAGNAAFAAIASIRPKTTFNSINYNRTKFVLDNLDILVRGANAIKWELVVGATLGGTPSWSNVDATYSAFEYDTAGTNSSGGIVIASGTVAASNQVKGSISRQVANQYPITLDAAGTVRANGTLTLRAYGYGGTSTLTAAFNWIEIR